jgi:hypothetical protein
MADPATPASVRASTSRYILESANKSVEKESWEAFDVRLESHRRAGQGRHGIGIRQFRVTVGGGFCLHGFKPPSVCCAIPAVRCGAQIPAPRAAELRAQGLSYRLIASRLGVGEGTIRRVLQGPPEGHRPAPKTAVEIL